MKTKIIATSVALLMSTTAFAKDCKYVQSIILDDNNVILSAKTEYVCKESKPIIVLPPKTTDGTVPINFAVKPLSKAPNSFEDPINIEFTEATLPLSSSGVFNCKIVCLIIIDIPSVRPYKKRANSDK